MPLLTSHDDARRPILLVGGLSALLRLVWVAAMSRPPKGLSDPALYVTAAEGIARGRGYLSITGTPTSYYPPGYPLFLGGIQWVLDRVGLGDHLVLAAGVVQALLGGVTAAAIVVVGRRLGGVRLGVVAGLIVACWPNLIMHSSLMLSESLFLAVFAVLLAAVVDLPTVWRGRDGRTRDATSRRRAGSTGTIVVAGLAMGLCTLIRPQSAVLLLPAIALVWAVTGVGWREWSARVAVLVAGVVLVVGPWTVRNLVVLDAFVPVSTNTGDNLCMGFNEDATGGFMLAEDCQTGEFYTDGPEAEVRRDAEARDRAVSWALDNVGELPALSLDKLRITYSNDRDALVALESFGEDAFLSDGSWRAMGIAADVYFFMVSGAALLGAVLLAPRAWRLRSRESSGLLVLAVTLASMIVPIAAFGDTRFKVPVAPCFALLGAVALLGVWGLVGGYLHRDEPREDLHDDTGDETLVETRQV